MLSNPLLPSTLSFDSEAWLRCFLVADIFQEVYGEPLAEYGMIGLAERSASLHVVETPLLPGQEVTERTVEQTGINVLALRREIQELSRRRGTQLIPVTFIHRHPRGCQPSQTDLEFLSGVFIDQVSTVHTFRENVAGDWEDLLCRRCSSAMPSRPRRLLGRSASTVVEYALAFSLIVNMRREHSLTAVRRDYCPNCGAGRLGYVPADISVSSSNSISSAALAKIHSELEAEIARKVHFCPDVERS